MEQECIFLTRKIDKSYERGSYDYYLEKRRGAPPGIVHPISFINSKSLHFPVGFTDRLAQCDKKAIEELRKKAMREGRWKDGVPIKKGEILQVRRNYGGICTRSSTRKLMRSVKQIDTSHSGFRIIIRDFEV